MRRFFSLFFLITPFSFLYADEAAPQKNSFLNMIILLVVGFLFFYILIWRPEKKRRKEAERKRSALKKGDKITAMGIIGQVTKVLDETIIVKMYDGSQVEFLKGAVSEIHPASAEDIEKQAPSGS